MKTKKSVDLLIVMLFFTQSISIFCRFLVIFQAEERKKFSDDPLAHKNAFYSSSQDILKYITDLGISKAYTC